MSTSYPGDIGAREGLDRILGELRPKLHRYTARMTGSSIDGEDVVQDAMVKAIEAFPAAGMIANVEGWVFRIIHNAALDFLRRRGRQSALYAEGDPEMIVDPVTVAREDRIAATSLRTFMQLPPSHRSSVILMDVLGYSLEEIAEVTDLTVAAVKAALHKGRMRLRDLAQEPDERPAPILDEAERLRLAAYVDRFNARDFDALRDLLADDVRLDLFNKSRRDGRKEVSRYFDNYQRVPDWHLVAGLADGRPAILVFDPEQAQGEPVYFIVLEWAGEQISRIRDFRYACYATAEAELTR
jgi:RNA polymerase sigma-70 factor, ECF subfamily